MYGQGKQKQCTLYYSHSVTDKKAENMTYQRQTENDDEEALWRQQAQQELIQALNPPLSAGGLIRLHSRYKYALMAYSPQIYKSSGRLLSQAGTLSPAELAETAAVWQQMLLTAFSQPATRANMTNALMHMQGYFKRLLSPAEKQQMSAAIEAYRTGTGSAAAVKHLLLTTARHYQTDYLCEQAILQPVTAAQSHSGRSSV
ncbi:TPA: YbgA family protein [Morganella morganii]|nr:YbgA family protein [Morganella morganii]